VAAHGTSAAYISITDYFSMKALGPKTDITGSSVPECSRR
jgi:hypothetical protein